MAIGVWFRKSNDCWYVTIDGVQVGLGVRGEERRSEAERAASDHTAARFMNTQQRQLSTQTVKAVLDAFLADAKGRVKANTYATYAGLLSPVAAQFALVLADDFKSAMLLKFVNRPSWGNSHRHNVIGAVQTAFKWAVEVDLIASNPLRHIKRPSKASRGIKALVSPDTHLKLLDASSPALRLLLTLLHETGARPSELSRLSALDVDFLNSVCVLTEHKSSGTTGKPRLIFLSGTAMTLLREQVAKYPDGSLLRNMKGSSWNKDGIGHAVRRACKRAGVKAIAYGYRHTFATTCLSKSIPDATVAALLGHSSTTMLHKHYSHLTSMATTMKAAIDQVRR